MKKEKINFDNSLPSLVSEVEKKIGNAFGSVCYLRDAVGKLAVIFNTELTDDQIENVEKIISEAIGDYAKQPSVICVADDLGNAGLLKQSQSITVDGHTISLIDRRIVGADWLLEPAKISNGIPRIIFASIKGGVGRSTALCVSAAHLSRAGKG